MALGSAGAKREESAVIALAGYGKMGRLIEKAELLRKKRERI
jgi:hypothetical protein